VGVGRSGGRLNATVDVPTIMLATIAINGGMASAARARAARVARLRATQTIVFDLQLPLLALATHT
jgi:hypothetical protein